MKRIKVLIGVNGGRAVASTRAMAPPTELGRSTEPTRAAERRWMGRGTGRVPVQTTETAVTGGGSMVLVANGSVALTLSSPRRAVWVRTEPRTCGQGEPPWPMVRGEKAEGCDLLETPGVTFLPIVTGPMDITMLPRRVDDRVVITPQKGRVVTVTGHLSWPRTDTAPPSGAEGWLARIPLSLRVAIV
jgi:hypothetical protein